jgi:hypothetical protein
VCHIFFVKAPLILNDKIVLEDGSIIEVRIWSVPEPVPPTEHGYKYSLFFGRPGERLVGFDNERGKVDHKHMLGTETRYVFTSIAQLLQDFRKDVETVRGTPI